MRPTNASLPVDKTTRKLEKTSSRNRERFIHQQVAVIFANYMKDAISKTI
jgi:hypothetical protein